jgi:hypothetical protein
VFPKLWRRPPNVEIGTIEQDGLLHKSLSGRPNAMNRNPPMNQLRLAQDFVVAQYRPKRNAPRFKFRL